MEKPRKIVYIISSMRAGSTLLKALIATRPDASDLPEVPFRFVDGLTTDKEIVVIKKPAWYKDWNYYPPDLPAESKKIILIRNPYDTVCSLRKMNTATGRKNLNKEKFMLSYWIIIYQNILNKLWVEGDNCLFVRYENLVENPIRESGRIFEFIGSKFTKGTDTYNPPQGHEWVWGKDDGGNVIKTLKVMKIDHPRTNNRLLKMIETHPDIQRILYYFGY